ncbi:MAG TPA: DUF952 domain-containing protein [Agriterribacter sp.]|nr:DUF952 domain-containing protein [Chitinophagaceae bacterium]HRP30963.1 DUF952 domain-containing protein [Agriterribacter sp.]
MALIYHITSASEWNDAQQKGFYASGALKEEGFIHCCEERQIPDVLNRFYTGKTNLVKLTIQTEKLTSQLIYDWSNAIEDTFPHVYGPINLDAVTAVENL